MLIQDGNWRSKLHRITELSVALLVVVMLIVASSEQMTNSVNINSYGAIKVLLPLHVEGQWIVDSNGTRVQLRGAASNYLAYGDWSKFVTYVSWMKQTGCDSIRLVFNMPNPDNLWSGGGAPYDATSMTQALNLLQQNGIYAILDCHDSWGTIARQGSEGLLPDYNQTWIDDWVSIANTFKNNPTIAMYELFNEPYDTSGNNTQIMQQFYIDCTNAIRATGDNHIVMCWEGDFSNSSQILPNMCLDQHNWWAFGNYSGAFSTGGANFFPEDLSSSPNQFIAAEMYASEAISSILELRSTFGCPVMLGEMGVYNYSMSSPDVYNNQLEIIMAEQYGIPWEEWWMDGWIGGQYGSLGPTFWTTFVNQELGGAFTSNYVSSSIPWNQTINWETINEAYGVTGKVFSSFPALPFNIWNNINTTASTFYYDNWGVTYITIPTQTMVNIVFDGPCVLRVQDWSYGGPYWGTIAGDQYINLTAGQTTSITIGSYSAVVIYAWANSPTYLPLPNG